MGTALRTCAVFVLAAAISGLAAIGFLRDQSTENQESTHAFVSETDMAPVASTEEVTARQDSDISAALTSTELSDAEPFTASLQSLLTSGGDYGCYYEGPEDDGDITGAIFISNGRARGTLIGNIFNEPGSLAYFLINGNRFYLWYILPDSMPEDLRGKAYLTDFTDRKEKEEMKNEIVDELHDLYGCVPWEFEVGFFELPRDLEYIDEEGAPVVW